jgi:hypothetical protein
MRHFAAFYNSDLKTLVLFFLTVLASTSRMFKTLPATFKSSHIRNFLALLK